MTVDLSKLAQPKVKLVGQDGNAFAILGRARQAMKKAGWDKEAIEQFTNEATSGDYNKLLQTVMKYCDDPDDEDEE